MVTITLFLASFFALDAGTTSHAKVRTDESALKASIKVVDPWCHGRPRVRLKLKNVSQKTVWLDLERSSKQPIDWMHYSYFEEQGGGESSGGNEDGDFLGFLRSGESARLDPGESGTWVLELGPLKLHAGQATLTIDGPVVGTTNLDDDHTTEYDFHAEISVKLKRTGRCYSVGAANMPMKRSMSPQGLQE